MVENGANSPIKSPQERVARVGHALPMNVTTVAFFLPEASQIADLRKYAKKLLKRLALVAHEGHAPSQGWCVWRLSSTGGVSGGRSMPWSLFVS